MPKIIQQEDHLILPKSTLRRFVDDKQEISVLDLNDFSNVIVRQKRPRSYHTEVNYYDPQFDNEVKKRERLIGILNTKCFKAIEEIENSETPSCVFDEEELKNQIVDLATIEFHRLAIVDDAKLAQYRDLQQKRNDDEDKRLIKAGLLDKDRCEYSTNYREKATDLNSFRGYAQNILGTDNEAIINAYKTFDSIVLYVPSNDDYAFWLPPFHFIGNECFLIFVIAPRIALALYPPNVVKEMKRVSNSAYPLFFKVDKVKTDTINSRAFEGVGVMPDGFKEIIGQKSEMEALKNFFEQLRDHIVIEKTDVKLSGLKNFLTDELSVFRTAIVVQFLCGEFKGIRDLIIEPDTFVPGYLKSDKNRKIADTFAKYSFELRVEYAG